MRNVALCMALTLFSKLSRSRGFRQLFHFPRSAGRGHTTPAGSPLSLEMRGRVTLSSTRSLSSVGSLIPRATVGTNDSTNEKLLEELKAMRSRIAKDNGKPASAIYSNAVLESICESRPSSAADLERIKGVGPRNAAYWPHVLQVLKMEITGFEERQVQMTLPPSRPKKESTKKALHVDDDDDEGEPELSAEQQSVLDRVMRGRNTFITGSAGTGKSFLLRQMVGQLQDKYGEDAVAVTASTGIAAINIGGRTIHSFAGIGLCQGSTEDIIEKVRRNRKVAAVWRKTKVLIIDEISMLDRQVFEVLDEIARRLRRGQEPFGGIQIVVIGDFLQLPPVSAQSFCFESKVWTALGLSEPDALRELTEVFRQQNRDFIELLNAVRVGDISNGVLSTLNSCCVERKPQPADGIIPTRLYCTNVDVDRENAMRLAELRSEEEAFDATDFLLHPVKSAVEKKALEDLADKKVGARITLKLGAQVMLTRNTASSWRSEGLANGQRGVVIRFVTEHVKGETVRLPVVRFDSGVIVKVQRAEWEVRSPGQGVLLRRQLPLKLAWALTVHKSQGCTLSRAEVMVHNSFDFGQAYTALSRVTSIEGLWITKPLRRDSFRTNTKVLDYYKAASQAVQ